MATEVRTVGQLRKAIAKLPDDYPLSVEAEHIYSEATWANEEAICILNDLETRLVIAPGDWL